MHIKFTDLVKLIHPDHNPHITDPSGKMTLALAHRKDDKVLWNLAVKWNVACGPRNVDLIYGTDAPPRPAPTVTVNRTPDGFGTRPRTRPQPRQNTDTGRRSTGNARLDEILRNAERARRARIAREIREAQERAHRAEERLRAERAREIREAQERARRAEATAAEAERYAVEEMWEARRTKAEKKAWNSHQGWNAPNEEPDYVDFEEKEWDTQTKNKNIWEKLKFW